MSSHSHQFLVICSLALDLRTGLFVFEADDEEEEDDDEASRRSSRSTTITTLPTATFLSVSDDSNESIAEILQRVSQLGPTRFRG